MRSLKDLWSQTVSICQTKGPEIIPFLAKHPLFLSSQAVHHSLYYVTHEKGLSSTCRKYEPLAIFEEKERER